MNLHRQRQRTGPANLVLISGNVLAHYHGRKQGAVVKADKWDDRLVDWVEKFRVRGEHAISEFGQGTRDGL